MTEKELILKIKTLKRIQPDKNWIQATKTQILGQEHQGFSVLDNLLDNLRALFDLNPLRQRAFLVVSGMTLILVAGILYNNITAIKTASLDVQTLESLAANLETVHTNLLQAINDLEKIENPNKVVEVQKNVGLTLESGKKVVDNIKQMVEERAEKGTKDKESPEVLTVLNKIESAADDLEQTMLLKQQELAEGLIAELETKSLTEEQKTILEQAKEYYNDKNFSEALIKAIEVSQVR